MSEQFSRTENVLGRQTLDKLSKSRVCVFGVGGVGGYVVEALARSGIGAIDVVDNDKVAVSNLNRQIIALHSTIGRDKADVMRERILDINPGCIVRVHKCFYLPENGSEFNFDDYDYVVDAIDTVTAKIDIIVRCIQGNTPVISSMGTGNKTDPTKLEVTDIYKTETDPLARVMRRELKKRGIERLKVVYSREKPQFSESNHEMIKDGSRPAPGSTAFVPSVAGIIIASEVVRDLIR